MSPTTAESMEKPIRLWNAWINGCYRRRSQLISLVQEMGHSESMIVGDLNLRIKLLEEAAANVSYKLAVPSSQGYDFTDDLDYGNSLVNGLARIQPTLKYYSQVVEWVLLDTEGHKAKVENLADAFITAYISSQATEEYYHRTSKVGSSYRHLKRAFNYQHTGNMILYVGEIIWLTGAYDSIHDWDWGWGSTADKQRQDQTDKIEKLMNAYFSGQSKMDGESNR